MLILIAPVFLLSGSPRVGKTSIAREIARAIDGSFVSFGDYVRSVAVSTANSSAQSRKNLQDLGQQLVTSDPRGFCAAALGGAAENPATPLVVDGLRHLSLLPVIKELLPSRDQSLIFIESNSDIRKTRWGGHSSEGEITEVDSHPVESDLMQLRQQADLIIDTSSGLETSFRQFIDWLAIKFPNLPKASSIHPTGKPQCF